MQDYVQGNRDTLAGFGADPSGLASLSGLKSAAGALGPTLSQGTGDVAYEAAVDMKNAQDALDAEEAAEIEATTTANDQERADYQMTFMRQADIGEDEIQETLEMNDLGEYYVPPESAANGGIMGRTGFRNGGIDQYKTEEEKYIVDGSKNRFPSMRPCNRGRYNSPRATGSNLSASSRREIISSFVRSSMVMSPGIVLPFQTSCA